MAEKRSGFIAGLSRFIGLFRGLFLPFGLFSILAVGIHSGSDHVDDHTFVLYNWLDGWLDRALAAVVRFSFTLINGTEAEIAKASYQAADLIDLEVKQVASRFTALIVEILADVMLALPVFWYRARTFSIRDYLRDLKDITVLKIVAPISAVFASLAGILIISREVQVAVHSGLNKVSFLSAYSGVAASVAGLLALLLVTWRLGWVVTYAAARWAELRANDDREEGVKPIKRRMRGWVTALVALPISIWALIDAISMAGSLRALIPV